MSRLSVAPIIRGHWKGLTNGVGNTAVADWTARIAFTIIPLGVATLTVSLQWCMAQPGPLLSGVSLLAGALLGAFAQLSSLRLKITEWSTGEPRKWEVERELIDETAAHILFAAMLCATDAALLVVAMNVTPPNMPVEPGWSAPILGIASYIFLMFIVCLPRLYSAYVQINSVSDKLSGFTRGSERRS
jgi:hypothetical protein